MADQSQHNDGERVRVTLSKRPLEPRKAAKGKDARRALLEPLPAGPFRSLGLLFLPCFLLFMGRLVQMGVVEAAPLREEYAHILERHEQRAAPRGQILDRTGTPLAESVVSYDAWAVTKVIDPRVIPELAEMLATATPVPKDKLEAVLR
ncbi:MAG: hypothetical protein ABI743_00660, partial [bacterium]